MSIQDLNTPLDFARATNSLVGNALLTLGLPFTDPTKWEIVEGAFKANDSDDFVLFHVFQTKAGYQAALPQMTDSGGRRKAIYRFPYSDGGATDDLGRDPEEFQINVLFFGNDYMTGWSKLIREIQKPIPGVLRHPVRGNIPCVYMRHRFVHDSSQRKAMLVEITFLEHTFSADLASLKLKESKDLPGFLGKALKALSLVSNIITSVQGNLNFATGFITQMTNQLTEYKSTYGSTLQKLNATFNAGQELQVAGLVGLTSETTEAVAFSVLTTQTDQTSTAIVSRETAQAIAVQQAISDVNTARSQADAILSYAQSSGAELEMYEDLLSIRSSAILLQQSLEAGLASSRARVIEYVLPRLMSLREVAFTNGLSPDRMDELLTLNPFLLSTNYIEKGTTLRVPIS